jgi:hypothetical protein
VIASIIASAAYFIMAELWRGDMTSEVLILNKRAIVIGADSAVTTSGGEHPRYSKTANKIFELSQNGNVAAAIYEGASVDGVPWELALKIFRSQLGGAKFDYAGEYGSALLTYLNANSKLFPKTLRDAWIQSQFDDALKALFQEAVRIEPKVFDKSVPDADRTQCGMQPLTRSIGFSLQMMSRRR